MEKLVCGYCGIPWCEVYIEGFGRMSARYCPKCGHHERKPRTSGDPRGSIYLAAVYGPPFEESYYCKECGKKFIESGLGVSKNYEYCPYCGEAYKKK